VSGIYLHIPFCKQACHYCNFHFSTSLKHKEVLIDAMLKEIEMRKDYLKTTALESIYFGGGTPSLLTQRDLERLFEKIYAKFSVVEGAEITLEANPDDLDKSKLEILQQLPVNRLSIGVQSFFKEDLEFWNRAHNQTEAEACIKAAQDAGFHNLTVDLIYGSPTTPDSHWKFNIEKLLAFEIPHLSCYALTVEEKTALAHFVNKGKTEAPSDEHAARQFEMLMEAMHENGYDHYEISNFAKPEFYAVHNAAYWKGKKYLGIGPAAHSFNGHSRQWNIANNSFYIKAVESLFRNEVPAKPLFEKEMLTTAQQYNEYVMTGLRTIWGCSEEKINAFGEIFKTYFPRKAQTYLATGHMNYQSGNFTLTPKGKLLADQIASQLFYLEEDNP
jgi:oxygen-independent coproporphyrinogen-3 oxidase